MHRMNRSRLLITNSIDTIVLKVKRVVMSNAMSSSNIIMKSTINKSHNHNVIPDYSNIIEAIKNNDTDILRSILDKGIETHDTTLLCFLFYNIGKQSKLTHKVNGFKIDALIPQVIEIFSGTPLQNHINTKKELIRVSPSNTTIRLKSSIELKWLLSGLQNTSSVNETDLKLIKSITKVINNSLEYINLSKHSYSIDDISLIIYGLKCMHSEQYLVRQIISIISNIINKTYALQDIKSLKEWNISQLFSGLQGLNSNSIEVINLLETIIPILYTYNGNITVKDYTLIMYSLRNLSSQHEQTIIILNQINKLVTKSSLLTTNQISISTHQIIMMLNGLRYMSSSYIEVIHTIQNILDLYSHCNDHDITLKPFQALLVMDSLGNKSSDDHYIINNLIVTVTLILRQCAGSNISSRSCAAILINISKLNCNLVEAQELIQEVTRIISRCKEAPRAQELSIMMAGMKNLTSNVPVVNNLVRVVTKLIRRCKQDFNGQGLAMLMSGMKGLCSSYEETKDLVVEVTKILSKYTNKLTAQECAMIMSGIRGLKSYHTEVIDLITQINRLLSTCTEPMTSQGCAMMLSGFHNLSVENRTTLELVVHISRLISSCNEPPTVQGVSMIMHGLSRLYGDYHDEVLFLILEVERLINNCIGEVTPTSAAMLMSGIKGLSQYPQMMGLLAGVKRLLSQCTEELTVQQASMVVYGLRFLKTDEEVVADLVVEVERLVSSCKGPVLPQSAAMLVNGLQGLSPLAPKVLRLISEVTLLITSCDEGLSVPEYFLILRGVVRMSGNFDEEHDLVAEVTRLFSISSCTLNSEQTDELMKCVNYLSRNGFDVNGLEIEIGRLSLY